MVMLLDKQNQREIKENHFGSSSSTSSTVTCSCSSSNTRNQSILEPDLINQLLRYLLKMNNHHSPLPSCAEIRENESSDKSTKPSPILKVVSSRRLVPKY